MTDSTHPARGLVAGKYEVLRLIGRGGMGSVWEGRHHSLGTRVAVKFVDPEYAESQNARSRFVIEARAAASIQSRHAVQIYDHGVTDDGRPYIVMELLVGEPLDQRIQRLGRLSLPETARIIAQVCRALSRAHDAGIIHRDLKPENIFVVRSTDDDEEIAKVLDFGIAKIRPPPGEEPTSNSTKTGAVLGTPYYMSPEQARGFRDIDHRTDLWSLGVIAYKCVTGVLPFDGQSVGDLLVKICTNPLPVPSAVASLPPAFDHWFERALERDLDLRFHDALELSDALMVAAGLSVQARRHSDGHTRRQTPTGEPSPPGQNGRVGGLPDASQTASGAAAPTVSADAAFTAPLTASGSSRKSSVGPLVAVVALLSGSAGVGLVYCFASPSDTAGGGATRESARSPRPAHSLPQAPSTPPLLSSSPSALPVVSASPPLREASAPPPPVHPFVRSSAIPTRDAAHDGAAPVLASPSPPRADPGY